MNVGSALLPVSVDRPAAGPTPRTGSERGLNL
jgi:hypothetical protein